MREEYLGELIEKDFVKEIKIKTTKTYTITNKSVEYLSKYNLITDFIQSFELD